MIVYSHATVRATDRRVFAWSVDSGELIKIHRLIENLMWSCPFEDITGMDKADTELALERQEVAEEVVKALHLDADEPVLTTSMSENE